MPSKRAGGDEPDGPFLRLEETGGVVPIVGDVTTIGRGDGVDVSLEDQSVSRLHAEIVRRGPYLYVSDMGLSTNGTRVNGRPIGRRVLHDGDVITFGAARVRVGGVEAQPDDAADASDTMRMKRVAAPDLTRREFEVLNALCRPALSQEAFVAPAAAKDIARQLVVTEAAVKQHLLRLYTKFKISEGPNRRARLANEVVSAGIVRPLPEMAPDPPRAVRAAE